tara:strand:- start:2961 stop:3161 length:201 start_codon:yes stop_codon:yes gene_type:complete
MSLNELVEMNNMFTAEELVEIMNMEVNLSEVKVDEDLVTDFISIAGYTEDEAYAAAEEVSKYDNLF